VVQLEVRTSRSVVGFPRPNLRLLTAVVVLALSLAATGVVFGASQANTAIMFTVPGPGVINPSAPPPPPPTYTPPTYTPPPTVINPSAPPPPYIITAAPLTEEELMEMSEWYVLYMEPYANP
jgi:hypothetical protein